MDTTELKQRCRRLERKEARRSSEPKRDADVRNTRWYVNTSISQEI